MFRTNIIHEHSDEDKAINIPLCVKVLRIQKTLHPQNRNPAGTSQLKLVQREYLIHCEKWLAFYFSLFFFYFSHLVHPLVSAGSKSSGRKGQHQFLDSSAGRSGWAGAGEARRNLYLACIQWAGCLGLCVSPPAVCISSFFTEFFRRVFIYFGGRRRLWTGRFCLLRHPSKKLPEKAVCATPKRATLKKKKHSPRKKMLPK